MSYLHNLISSQRFINFRHFLGHTRGATAIEYGLIAALIAVAAIAAMQGMGNSLKTTFGRTSSSMVSSA